MSEDIEGTTGKPAFGLQYLEAAGTSKIDAVIICDENIQNDIG